MPLSHRSTFLFVFLYLFSHFLSIMTDLSRALHVQSSSMADLQDDYALLKSKFSKSEKKTASLEKKTKALEAKVSLSSSLRLLL